ncbi:unnamed protein product [Polarella glacialis]|uniref:NADAR domain-containing protein n=1 Tax=Polarella glacialis TaxID=89957 RepID=A0A813GMC7_POLGL|nr:unnamed protein product [Polarella glacialis]
MGAQGQGQGQQSRWLRGKKDKARLPFCGSRDSSDGICCTGQQQQSDFRDERAQLQGDHCKAPNNYNNNNDNNTAANAPIAGSCQVAASSPTPTAFPFLDPRSAAQEWVEFGLIAFYYPDHEEACDTLCSSSFLGNFFPLVPDRLELPIPQKGNRSFSFQNAEAAFQSLKFWRQLDKFEQFELANGTRAFELKCQWRGQEDWSYAGYQGNWQAMLAVLRSKFTQIPRMEKALRQTLDAFLLEHNSRSGSDTVWSDNGDGKGWNWLGIQLMLVRDEINGCADAATSWTSWLRRQVDVEKGSCPTEEWQQLVSLAAKAIRGRIDSSQFGQHKLRPHMEPLKRQPQQQSQQQQQQQLKLRREEQQQPAQTWQLQTAKQAHQAPQVQKVQHLHKSMEAQRPQPPEAAQQRQPQRSQGPQKQDQPRCPTQQVFRSPVGPPPQHQAVWKPSLQRRSSAPLPPGLLDRKHFPDLAGNS